MDPAAPESNAAAPPPPGAVVVNVAAAAAGAAAAAAPARRAAAWPARNPRSLRPALALALLVLGFAAASLAFFAASLPAANAGVLAQGRRCFWTEEEEADLREAAQLLLVTASAQVLAATAAFVPTLPLIVVALTVGSYTALSAADVVWLLLACHGHVHGVAAFHYWFFYAVMLVTLLVGGLLVIASLAPSP